MRSIQRPGSRTVTAGAVLILCSLLAAQPPAGQPGAGQPGAGAPPRGRAISPAPKAGVFPLPILPALPAYGDQTFFTRADVPHGKIEQPTYKNYAGEDKQMHVYLPPDYERNSSVRYPVLYLNHGGGDDDAKWSAEDPAAAVTPATFSTT